MTLLRFDTYLYYCQQPLVLWDLPLWRAPVNALVDVAVAALVVRHDAALGGIRQLLIIPLAMATSAAANTVVGWPSWPAVNSDLGDFGRQLAGPTTFAVALLLTRLLAARAGTRARRARRARRPGTVPAG